MSIGPLASPLSTPSGLTLDELKQSLFQNIRYRLGEGIIDLELDPQHLEAAYNYTIKLYLYSIFLFFSTVYFIIFYRTTSTFSFTFTTRYKLFSAIAYNI